MTTKRKFMLGLILLISHLIFFIAGANLTRYSMNQSFRDSLWKANAEVNFGRYVEYRGISSNINVGKYADAKCFADLGASGLYEKSLTCLKNRECALFLQKLDVRRTAPELLDKKIIGFKYYATENGIRSCK
ncbi:hypothetical protein ACFQ2T_06485 [Methylophilus flavus]|uniref:Uncharacterized protein n=1 Tax=Methylophilus flavus TaxID=640084 RepID=A0ABW3PCC9_9PROT